MDAEMQQGKPPQKIPTLFLYMNNAVSYELATLDHT